MTRRILIATSNPGKLEDFAGAAAAHGIEIGGIPDFSSLPPVVEDGLTFEANARKKAEAYSCHVPGEIVVGDDSGLEVDALQGAPGVHSARYAGADASDADRIAKLLDAMRDVPPGQRSARFCLEIGDHEFVPLGRYGVLRLRDKDDDDHG